jgi:hypothetical protein
VLAGAKLAREPRRVIVCRAVMAQRKATVMSPSLLDSPLYPTTTTTTSISPVVTIIYLAVVVFYIACQWIIFTKAGKPGWAAIIPIYSTIVFLNIIGRSGWWILILFVPIVNLIFLLIFVHELSKAFGHGIGFTLGLIFLSIIFIPILAFGGSKYVRAPQMAYAR